MRAWSADDWLNHGGEAIASDPALGQRLISHGIKQIPDQGIAWFNLGLALHQRRRIPAAIRAYQQALACQGAPVAEATNNLAQDLLLNGQWDTGWPLYEQRLRRAGATRFTTYVQHYGEAWQGWDDPRPCEELIIVAEQGLGDTLQFARLIQILRCSGIQTKLLSPEALAPLLRSNRSLGDISLMLANHSPGVRWCPLMSLPHRLHLRPEKIPLAEGYLEADPERIQLWKGHLQRRPNHRLIALHWQGNPNFERKLYSQGRSMPFDAWLGLQKCPNVEFLSIQKGSGQDQLRTDAGLSFVAGQGKFDASFDFRDTAAALANCDMLLSADSSVVHLAGAMGLPTWIALSWVPEWRWGLEGVHTPWYSSARLFRQSYSGDWDGVVSSMAKAICKSI